MSRFIQLTVLLFVVSLCHVIQATPLSEQDQTPKPDSNAESLEKTMESIQQQLGAILKDIRFNDLIKDGTELLTHAAESIRRGAEEMIPKTD